MSPKFNKMHLFYISFYNGGIAFSYHRLQERLCPTANRPVSGGGGRGRAKPPVACLSYGDLVTWKNSAVC